MKIYKDEFNSRMFGIEMANITYDDAKELEDIDKILDESKDYDHISVKVDTADKRVIQKLNDAGFYLVDSLITAKIASDKKIDYSTDVCVREARPEETDRIADIAAKAFGMDRYHTDDYLDNEKCDEYYRTWLKNSCNGFADGVFVAVDGNDIMGFITVKMNRETKEATLVLGAVDPAFRGRGAFKAVEVYAINYLSEQGMNTVYHGTQLGNIPIQRLWESLGFKVCDIKYVLHKNNG